MTRPAASWSAVLDRVDLELEADWARFVDWWIRRYDRDPTVESALFLVGLQALARGAPRRMSKEEKQDAIMEGTYRVLETVGMYRRVDDATWERTGDLPVLSTSEQEKLLRAGIIRYFEPVMSETIDRKPSP
jgi:hypothetical protein